MYLFISVQIPSIAMITFTLYLAWGKLTVPDRRAPLRAAAEFLWVGAHTNSSIPTHPDGFSAYTDRIRILQDCPHRTIRIF